jgi:hypothetical protein
MHQAETCQRTVVNVPSGLVVGLSGVLAGACS